MEQFYTDYNEEIVYPDFYVSYTYINNELRVKITYEDTNRLISSIRVYLQKPKIEGPALSANAISRIASFPNLEKIENQEIEVVVIFKDKHEIRIPIEIKIKKSNNLIWLMLIYLIIQIITLVFVISIHNKRKRLH